MGWMSRVVILVTLRYISSSLGSPHPSVPVQDTYLEENAAYSDVDSNIAALENKLNPTESEEDGKFQLISNYLTYILLRPWPVTGLPLLYVEDFPGEMEEYKEQEAGIPETGDVFDANNQLMTQNNYKRSRYYRKYPWKRQNSRETYEAENRYLCQPSKDDVFRLLVALHEARQGNRGHTIHFCNRKRPASAIFTNIRFLGKRK